MKKTGFTLIELTASIAIGSALALTMSQSFAGLIKTTFNTVVRFESAGEVDRLAARLLRETRLAQSCLRQASPVALVCLVDMHSPPTLQTADDTEVRYLFDSAGKRVEFSRRPQGGAWTVLEQFSGIGIFAVCGDNEMTAGTCPINDAISARHVANLTAGTNPTPPNRYFRVQIQSSSVDPIQPVRQVGIFVRHPLPLAGFSFEFASRD